MGFYVSVVRTGPFELVGLGFVVGRSPDGEMTYPSFFNTLADSSGYFFTVAAACRSCHSRSERITSGFQFGLKSV